LIECIAPYIKARNVTSEFGMWMFCSWKLTKKLTRDVSLAAKSNRNVTFEWASERV